MIVSALFGSRLVNCANSKHTRVNLYEKKMTQTPLMIAFQLLHYATKYCHFKCCVEEDHNSVGIRLFETTLDESAIIGHALQLHQWLLFISVTPPPPPYMSLSKTGFQTCKAPQWFYWDLKSVFFCLPLASEQKIASVVVVEGFESRGAFSCRWIAHTLYAGLSPQATKQVKWGWP